MQYILTEEEYKKLNKETQKYISAIDLIKLMKVYTQLDPVTNKLVISLTANVNDLPEDVLNCISTRK